MATAAVIRMTRYPEIEQIFESHYDTIYRTAFAITRSAADAEDVVQKIFMQLLQRGTGPDLTRNPQGYLCKAAINMSLQTIRTRRRNVSIDNLQLDERPVEVLPTDEKEEMDQRLWTAIGGLHETAARILILRYVENRSLSDIARQLGTTRSTVAVSLFRSRARLKKLIRAAEGGRP